MVTKASTVGSLAVPQRTNLRNAQSAGAHLYHVPINLVKGFLEVSSGCLNSSRWRFWENLRERPWEQELTCFTTVYDVPCFNKWRYGIEWTVFLSIMHGCGIVRIRSRDYMIRCFFFLPPSIWRIPLEGQTKEHSRISISGSSPLCLSTELALISDVMDLQSQRVSLLSSLGDINPHGRCRQPELERSLGNVSRVKH